jgi:thiosulfate/3-mercaptopyruvate sulfurtransferase
LKELTPLIQPDQLAARLGAADLRLVDASWDLSGRDCRKDFEAARLPGAVFFDLEASSDPLSPLPHMLPSPEDFARRMGGLGLSRSDNIVVYDSVGVWSSPRVWWMLTVMGADRVQVLDGGLPRWRRAGLPVESGPPRSPSPAEFQPAFHAEQIATMADVARSLADGEPVVDARSRARFRGEADEPRAGLRAGHMPGARSLPYSELLTADGALKDPDDLRAAFASAGVDIEKPITTTCGSGVTAALLSLALASLGKRSRQYDGSWAQWGSPTGGPVQTGP